MWLVDQPHVANGPMPSLMIRMPEQNLRRAVREAESRGTPRARGFANSPAQAVAAARQDEGPDGKAAGEARQGQELEQAAGGRPSVAGALARLLLAYPPWPLRC